jgi:hypothetical protein
VHLLWIMNEMCGGLCTTIGARFEGWLWFVTPSAGIRLPNGVRVRSGVSEVQVAFVTSVETVYVNHDDRALRLNLHPRKSARNR